MRLTRLFAILAVAGVALFGIQAPAAAAQIGSAVTPHSQLGAASSDVVEVGRRYYRRGWRRGYRRGYYGHRRGYYGYRGYRRPGVSIYVGPRRGYYRRGWRRGYW